MARTKGALNKATILQSYIGTKKDPAILLLKVLQDEGEDMDRRLDAAKTLMPYCHKKLPTMIEADVTASIQQINVNLF